MRGAGGGRRWGLGGGELCEFNVFFLFLVLWSFCCFALLLYFSLVILS